LLSSSSSSPKQRVITSPTTLADLLSHAQQQESSQPQSQSQSQSQSQTQPQQQQQSQGGTEQQSREQHQQDLIAVGHLRQHIEGLLEGTL
ncbi:hypothetical protein CF328_g7414, partial [Tilletia controversa]